MRVLLVDDHELVRNGIASLLTVNGIEVVGQASDGLEALEKARKLQPDVILMDIRMPICDGLEATRLIRAEMPEARIVILSMSDSDEDLFEAIRSGAQGFVLKNVKSEEFLSLLNGVSRGEAAISPGVALKIMEEFSRQSASIRKPARAEGGLTDREVDVLKLVARGALNKEIGISLSISENTVKYHMRNIMEKLHLTSKAQVAAYAVSKGMTPKELETIEP